MQHPCFASIPTTLALLAAITTPAQALNAVAAGDICVTNGEINPAGGGALTIDTPSSRAVLRYPTAQVAEIRFTYLGPTAGSKPLASGELRRQIGIKLLAQNTCNLVYAMWHIEPDSRVAVSIKRNAGMSTHEQCGAHGYINLKSSLPTSPPAIATGSRHVLRAELRGSYLMVSADGAPAWRGGLGGAITGLDGPVGLRTDNARFIFTYAADAKPPAAVDAPCARSAGD